METYNKRVVFWASCAGMLLFGICLITLGSIAPDLKQKFLLNDIAAGTMFSILPFGILTGSLLFGPVVDKYGYKILLSASCILLSAGFEGIALTSSPDLLKGFIFLIGFTGGIINGATNALVSDINKTEKAANLSLIGVFFGIGALGMPLIMGILRPVCRFETIVAAVGILSFLTGIFFVLIMLPSPKLMQTLPVKSISGFFKDKVLLLIASFLFFQSSFEGIINNWTTTYLTGHLSLSQGEALYGLSLFVAGMTVMRLLTGTFLKHIPVMKILIACFIFILSGLICIKSGITPSVALAGFTLLGAGLACGFPVMLGFVGERYAGLSGTAFSFVLTIGLLGNMLINYCMGIISQKFGISHLITVALAETVVLTLLCMIIMRKINDQNRKTKIQ